MVLGLEAALALLLIFGYKSAVTEKIDTWSGKVESSASENKTEIKESKKKGQREKTEKAEEEEELQEKKIAITFDDDVIIGLSQMKCYSKVAAEVTNTIY